MDLVGSMYPGRNPQWYELLRPLGVSATAFLAVLLAIVLTGAPWDGYLAVVAVIVGGFAALLAVVVVGFYFLDTV